jgi:hypothetical protein
LAGSLRGGRYVTVDISDDGGASWTTLPVIADEGGTAWHYEAFDITDYMSSQTQVRFYAKSLTSGYLSVDNVQIEFGRNPGGEPWLNECDFNHDLMIDCFDLCIFAEHWLD